MSIQNDPVGRATVDPSGPTGSWQPIKTAPKDGTVVLLFLTLPLDTSYLCGWIPAKGLNVVVGWADGFGRYRDPEYGMWQCGLCEDGSADTEGRSSALQINVYPTHWMPLPEPPQ